MEHYLSLPHIQVQGAYMRAAYVVGFPPITAWLGAVHGMERFIRKSFPDVSFDKTAVSCLRFQPFYTDRRFSRPRFPMRQSYEAASTVEEPKCNTEVSLVVHVSNPPRDGVDGMLERVEEFLSTNRMAGGIITDFDKPVFFSGIDGDTAISRKALASLMPGFVLLSREDLVHGMRADFVQRISAHPTEKACREEDPLDAVLGALQNYRVQRKTSIIENGRALESWEEDVVVEKRQHGWIVPIVTGYLDISGPVRGIPCRDGREETHFVEPVVTLGEYRFPMSMESIEECFWQYEFNNGNGTYLCRSCKDIYSNSI